jgi:cobalt-zinc-cadmium efflux system protein
MPPTTDPRATRRLPHATTIAALVNAGWLLILNLSVLVAAIRRLMAGVPEVHELPVLIVSAVAAAVMLIAALILGGDTDDEDDDGAAWTMKAVLLDTAADAAAAGGVAISGGVIVAPGSWYWLDPAVALVIAVVVGYQALRLIRKVVTALTSTKPPEHAEDTDL